MAISFRAEPESRDELLKRNKAVVRRLVDEMLNTGDLTVAEELWARDYAFHPGDGSEAMDRDTHKIDFRDLRTNFPDVHFTVESMVAEGDLVATRLTIRGTHRGPLPAPMGPVAPTEKELEWTAMTMHRVRDGKVVEGWINYDALGMLQQVGVLPPWKWSASAQRSAQQESS